MLVGASLRLLHAPHAPPPRAAIGCLVTDGAQEVLGAMAVTLLVAVALPSLARPNWLPARPDDDDDLTRRGARDALQYGMPRWIAPEPVYDGSPTSECITPEGEALLAELSSATFATSWGECVRSCVREAASGPPADSLEARIAQVQSVARQRRVLADCLAVAVEHAFDGAELDMLRDATAIAPGVAPSSGAATLVRVSQQFPGQSARQVRAFVSEAVPSADARQLGRFDRLQAARLQVGAIQFGYFVSQVFRGQADLDDETVLTADAARAVQRAIQRSTRMMKTEAAWAVTSRRAGRMFNLPNPNLPNPNLPSGEQVQGAGYSGDASWDSSLGFEALRDFTVGVQVVGAARQDEFFSTATDDANDDDDNDDDDDADDANDDAPQTVAGVPPVIRSHSIAFDRVCCLHRGR